MENKLRTIGKLAITSKAYIDNKFEYYKLLLVDKISGVLTKIVLNAMAAFVLGMLFFFISLSLAFAIGEWYGKIWFGFFAISVFYLFILFFLFILKNTIIRRPIENGIIKALHIKELEIKKS